MIEYFEENWHKFFKIRGTLSQDSAALPVYQAVSRVLAQGGSRLRNDFSKLKHSLSDCFGKLMEASIHVFWSLREGFLTFQLRFQTAGY